MIVKCTCGESFNCEKTNIVCSNCTKEYEFSDLQYVIKHHSGGFDLEYKTKELQNPKQL